MKNRFVVLGLLALGFALECNAQYSTSDVTSTTIGLPAATVVGMIANAGGGAANSSIDGPSRIFALNQNSGGSGAIQASINKACSMTPKPIVTINDTVTDKSQVINKCSDGTFVYIDNQRIDAGVARYEVAKFGARSGETDSRQAIQNAIDKCDADGMTSGYFGVVVFSGKYNIASSSQYTYTGGTPALTSTITSIVVTGNTANIYYTGADPVLRQYYLLKGLTSAAGIPLNQATVVPTYVDLTNHYMTVWVPPASTANAGTYTETGVVTNQPTAGLIYKSCRWISQGFEPRKTALTYTGTDNPDTLVFGAGPEVNYNLTTGGISGVELGSTTTVTTQRNFYALNPFDNGFLLQGVVLGPANYASLDTPASYTNMRLSGTRWDGAGNGAVMWNIGCGVGGSLSDAVTDPFTMATSTGLNTQPKALVRFDMTAACTDFGTWALNNGRIELNTNGNGIANGNGVFWVDSWSTTANKGGHIQLGNITIQNQVHSFTTSPQRLNYLMMFTQAAGDASGVSVTGNVYYTGLDGFKRPGDNWNGTTSYVPWSNYFGHLNLQAGAVQESFRSPIEIAGRDTTTPVISVFGPADDVPTINTTSPYYVPNNPRISVTPSGINFGPGGSSPTDTTLAYNGTGQLTLNGVALGSGGSVSGTNNTSARFNGSGSLISSPNLDTGTLFTYTEPVLMTTAGAASVSPFQIKGTLFTGGTASTTVPYHYLDFGATEPTSWNLQGTGYAVNLPASSTGYFFDGHVNGGPSLFNTGVGGTFSYYGFSNTNGGFTTLAATSGLNIANQTRYLQYSSGIAMPTANSGVAGSGSILVQAELGLHTTVASAATITPTSKFFTITGTTIVSNINYFGGISATVDGCAEFVTASSLSFATGGNIAQVPTAATGANTMHTACSIAGNWYIPY